tara:strand:+ start:2129 stop:2368 length:240 start_codon:yes stop_codon:yes gene_type:complete
MFTTETARVGGQKSKRSKSIDIQTIEKLTPLDDMAFNMLKQGIENGDFRFVKLFMQYRFGKPKTITEVTINSEVPLFSL